MLKKLLLLLIKYIPVIQMAGMLFNNTLYYFDIHRFISYTMDFIIGNSVINTSLILICSYIFKFCKWHRIIIITNFINLIIVNIDVIIGINITDKMLLITYYFIASIGVITATYIHIKYKKDECKIKIN